MMVGGIAYSNDFDLAKKMGLNDVQSWRCSVCGFAILRL